MSFQLLLYDLCFYNLFVTFTEKTNYIRGQPNAPSPPPRQLEKVNSDKYLTRWCCSKNDGFLFYITNLNFSTIIIALVRSYYILSKTWIRLFSLSHTTILPSLRFAVALGKLNSPLSLPSLPNFVTNFPFSSNTCTL